MKILNYFLQSIIVYFFFLLGRILGLKISRKIFSLLFSIVGPFFKSKKIIEKNLINFSRKVVNVNKKSITKDMWINYGKTFIEYIFLDIFQKKIPICNLQMKKYYYKLVKKKTSNFYFRPFCKLRINVYEITKKNIQLATIYRPLNNFFKSIYGIFEKNMYVKIKLKKE